MKPGPTRSKPDTAQQTRSGSGRISMDAAEPEPSLSTTPLDRLETKLYCNYILRDTKERCFSSERVIRATVRARAPALTVKPEAEAWAEGATAVQRIEGRAAKGMLRWVTDVPSEVSLSSALVIKVSVQSRFAARTSAECGSVLLFGEKPEQMADPGFGSIRLFWPEPAESPARGVNNEQLILDAVQKTRQIVHRYEGTTVVEQCPLPVKRQIDVWGDAPDSLAVMRQIKDRFDPRGILNPGRFLGGI